MKFWDIFHSFSVERGNSTRLRLVRFNPPLYLQIVKYIPNITPARTITYTYYTLHTEHAYCLSYRFLNNVVITTIIEMVGMVEILDGRLGKRLS